MSSVGIFIIVALMFAKPLWSAAKSTYAFASKMLPSPSAAGGFLNSKIEMPLWKVLLYLSAFWMISSGGVVSIPAWNVLEWKLPSIVSKSDAATYFWEKDQGGVPSEVMAGLNKLNSERKIVATQFEQDTKDGDGNVPEQYVLGLEAAKKNGLPSLVATSGGRVLKVTKDPKTVDDVLKGVP